MAQQAQGSTAEILFPFLDLPSCSVLNFSVVVVLTPHVQFGPDSAPPSGTEKHPTAELWVPS